ncbi:MULTISPECIES: hypothetical protein [unclassified Novosphingobium]|uniref:hypothetical protein n=1 Tax=unclassified Novosphingobium TaxID=2644732 RepID=UPI0025DA66C9|nr:MULTISPECIES: hypothetical protein [unclassified Novosphingobium]
MAKFGLPGRKQAAASPAEQQAAAAVASALAHVPPTMREMRAQAVHRLQVGLFGLAGMLLLVSLANVIMDRAKYIDASAVNTAAPVIEPSATSAKDPLADMGVAPKLPVSANEKPTVTLSPAPPAPAPSVNAPPP